jgi:hypothetical protein
MRKGSTGRFLALSLLTHSPREEGPVVGFTNVAFSLSGELRRGSGWGGR